MHFLAPLFAALTVLGVLPVLIHLHGRRRAKVQPLPTLLLLLASHRRVAQRTKLRHLLLLILRGPSCLFTGGTARLHLIGQCFVAFDPGVTLGLALR